MVTATGAPAGALRRSAKAAVAGALLSILVVGVPLALALLAGNPLPVGLPTWDGVWHTLISPDDGSLFLAVLTVVGWLAWAGFTASVAVEVVARLTHRQPAAIPGLRGPQRMASMLVAAVAALAVSPTLVSSDAAPLEAPPADPVAIATEGSGGAAAGWQAEREVPGEVVHLVERGEGLLDLQDRYGVPWQRIAEANQGVGQPDGAVLQRGQTRIYPGWQLRIPQQVTTAHAATGAVEAEAGHAEYEVAQGDWMWHIADRYLSDPERFRDIAALNPGYADRYGDFPDHIEPGWTLRLPADAVDGGAVQHATGVAEQLIPESGADRPSPAPAPDPPGPAAEEPGLSTDVPSWSGPPVLPDTPAPSALPRQPAATGAPATPEQTAPSAAATARGADEVPPGPSGDGPEETAAPTDDGTSEDPERLAPAALAGAGLLAALVLGALTRQRLRRNSAHEPGTLPASAASRRLEQTLRVAQQPLDAERLDAALRTLAAGLATRRGRPPDIAAVLVSEGTVELVLHKRCPDPPEPWLARGDRWTLPTGTPLPAVHGPLAPLPALATIGSQAGQHVLLDLERVGVLTLYGQPERTADLMRYLAAELAHHTWSDAVEVLLAGFPPAEAELLAELNPQRVRVLPSVADGVARLRRRAAAARAALRHTGAVDTLSGRVRGVAGDAWMPQVLLVAGGDDDERAAVGELERELMDGGRCAAAVVTTALEHRAPGGWRVTVSPDGVTHVRLPFLHTSLSAAALPVAELDLLAGATRQARVAPAEAAPPSHDLESWAVGTDVGGGIRPGGAREPEAGTAGSAATLEGPVAATRPGAAPRPYADPGLDDDLRAWYADDPGRPRIAVLGEVRLDAHGVPPEHRRRLHAELVVFLAQRGARGADAALLDSALWPGVGVAATTRQMLLSRARGWLGTDAGGNFWLTDVDADLTYRLAEGYLLDWHLFRRLRTRGELRAGQGADDLRAALRLVRGAPLDRADVPPAPGMRNPYPWLPESDLNPDVLVAAVVDVAHQLAELCLEGGDTEGLRWAVRQAWLADAARSYDQPWRDLLRAAQVDGDPDQARALLAELMEIRDAETPEELSPDTYRLVRGWLPTLNDAVSRAAAGGDARDWQA